MSPVFPAFPALPARRVLFVHAHPDDETLTTGGAIARYATDPDTACVVLTCSLGEEGEVIPPELRELAPDRGDQLGGYRVHELAGALAALGSPEHRFLGGLGRWRDSGMEHGEGTRALTPAVLHPRALAAPGAFDEQLAQLLAVVDALQPQVVVSYADDGGYGHPDHVRAHALTMAAAKARPEFVARVFHAVRSRSALDAGLAAIEGLPGMPFRIPEPDELPSAPDDVVTTRLDVSAHRAALVAAMRAHATQIAVWEQDGAVAFAMSNDVAQPLIEVEEYALASGAGPAPADDLFAGLD
ncbi:N-acetyl-1-D-myo-inositol-2-amino-2-deoxy-alpha-D-glucopyranoside deacetylase [Pseudonocardia kujensis]|uniref:N-acetyl-1-D-myo-inositol-2-amino-2-deoxy-alpha- D-glucopyranoside deacetylase n=1 Tax=Pseudonocardia kujensis TaxID=1128675 RepID=UPI001E3010A5|nr:N-acetyl-1-D-myo-inositol-2-amino-2-deoxy-alpha-D-glucopyranoside deacetylase [Pseudonocardia kujensis]MCE0766189.1 N-acetyl-1-D-myo-inositol-2-amino-2-deoxy-alpha-D-glucopyranoside deacetylase [Pseudonocardia kujensis]